MFDKNNPVEKPYSFCLHSQAVIDKALNSRIFKGSENDLPDSSQELKPPKAVIFSADLVTFIFTNLCGVGSSNP